MKYLLELLEKIFFSFKKDKATILLKEKILEPVIEPVVVPIVHSDVWCGGTLVERKEMLQLAYRVCQEEKLFPSMTNDLVLTIAGESGFNRWCVNHKSKDYGIAQFSALYYLKEYKMTPEDAINDPERCIRIMAKNFKAGRQSNWVAYKGRANHTKMIKELS